MSRSAVLLLTSALAASPATADEPPAARSRDVYRIDPVVDGAIIAAATAATLVPWLLEDRIIDLRCPCDPAEVPRWELFAIGNESPAADVASNATRSAPRSSFSTGAARRGDPERNRRGREPGGIDVT